MYTFNVLSLRVCVLSTRSMYVFTLERLLPYTFIQTSIKNELRRVM
jgi:hypothetical protein